MFQSPLTHMINPLFYYWQLKDKLWCCSLTYLSSSVHVSIPPEAVGFSHLHKWPKWTFSVPGWSQFLGARTPPQGAVTNPGVTCVLRRVFVSVYMCHSGVFFLVSVGFKWLRVSCDDWWDGLLRITDHPGLSGLPSGKSDTKQLSAPVVTETIFMVFLTEVLAGHTMLM